MPSYRDISRKGVPVKRKSNIILLVLCLLLLVGWGVLTYVPAMGGARIGATVAAWRAVYPHVGAQPGVFEDFPLNIALFRAINDRHTPGLDHFFLLYNYLGRAYVLIPVFVLVCLYRHTKMRMLVTAVLAQAFIVQVMKFAFLQPRPPLMLEDVHALIPLYILSFPSGDTALAFTLACTLAQRERRFVQGLLYLYASLIAYERIYLGVHFPLDVAVGALVGLLCGYAARRVVGEIA